MSEPFLIRRTEQGGFGVYRNDILLIFGLDNADVINLAKETNTAPSATNIFSCTSSGENTTPRPQMLPCMKTGRKPLILRPYLEDIKKMLARNPSVTAKQIEHQLRNSGAKFSSITAITNLARVHGLRIAA